MATAVEERGMNRGPDKAKGGAGREWTTEPAGHCADPPGVWRVLSSPLVGRGSLVKVCLGGCLQSLFLGCS